MKRYFLGLASNYGRGGWVKHLFTIGRKKDCDRLVDYLGARYGGKAVLCKNGRSALAMALKAYFKPGDKILVNGFTCYAVYEAVISAGLKPVFVDISKEDLNFDIQTLRNVSSGRFGVIRDNDWAGPAAVSSPVKTSRGAPSDGVTRPGSSSRPKVNTIQDGLEPPETRAKIRGIIIQNTLGNPVDMEKIEKFAKKHDLMIVEDLAHSAGVKYPDGREAGTVGVATVLSFGKDKAIDTISGGAVIYRGESRAKTIPFRSPRASDHLRARFYPMFGAMCRGLTGVHLGGALMRFLVAIHFVEKSADSKLDVERKISKFQAKLALKQMEELRNRPIRGFCLVDDRKKVLKELRKAGYYFSGFWYEKPVSPERYYKKVHFPESECPNAVFVSEHIINLPNYYSKAELLPAKKIIVKHLIRGGSK